MIKTERLALRPFEIKDAPVMHQKFGTDEDMYRYSGWNPFATVEEAESFIRMTLEDPDGHAHSWAVIYDGEIVGNIGVYNYEEDKNILEVGLIIEKGSWGKGFATEALKAVLKYVTEEEGVDTVTAWCASDNIGSKTAMEKCGMNLQSIEEKGLEIGEKTFDKLIYIFKKTERNN